MWLTIKTGDPENYGRGQQYDIARGDDACFMSNTAYYPSAPNIEDAREIVRRVNAYDDLIEFIKQETQDEEDCALCTIGIDHTEHTGCYCAQDGQCEFCIERAISNAENLEGSYDSYR